MTTTTVMEDPVRAEEEGPTGLAAAVVWLLGLVAANGSTLPLATIRTAAVDAGHGAAVARAARRLGRCRSWSGSWLFTFDPTRAAEVASGEPDGPHADRTPLEARAVAGIRGRALDRFTGGTR